MKNEIKQYVLVFLGGAIFALGVNLFITPLNLFSAGMVGISQIIRTLLIALPFSALGALLGMYVFHHKTKKFKFLFFIPLFLILQIILICYLKSILVI